MSHPSNQDLLALDREVAQASRALDAARQVLATSSWESAASSSPLEHARRVSGKKTRDSLLALSPSRADLSLRDGLARWIGALTGARVGWELEAEAERAGRAPDARSRSRATPIAEPGEGHQRAAVASLLRAASPGEFSALVDFAARRAPRIAAAQAERRAKLTEVARRFGAAHRYERALVHRPLGFEPPEAQVAKDSLVTASADLISVLSAELNPPAPDAGDAHLPSVSVEALLASAEVFLAASEPLARAVLRGAHRVRAGRDGIASCDLVFVALAREGRIDWPARLNPPWLHARFTALLGATTFPVGGLPSPLGASSFLRAASMFGHALRVTLAGRAQPFAVGRDPFFTDAHRLGDVFALAMASPTFLVRELGAGRASANDAVRALAASLLLDARARATALLVGAGDGAPGEPLETHDQALGGLFGKLAFTVPRVHDDEPARWLARLTAQPFADTLITTFDDDFYRNPRAGASLKARASRPALETTFLTDQPPDLSALASSLARRFETQLG